MFLTTLFGRYPKVKVAQMSTLEFPTTDKFYLHESAACHALLSGDLVPMLDGYALLWSCSGDVEFDPVSCSTKARLVMNLFWYPAGVIFAWRIPSGSSGSLAELSGAVVGLHGCAVAVLLTLLALFGGVVLGGSRRVFT